MGETDKPFACNISDCGMRFTNEDHLTVHKKKHDMCLNIGNGQKMNIFVADQTPTPTRFIRNCEEVGLFQDLQNVNPFEEQFRKAAEAVKSGTPTLHPEVEPMCGQTDDTLHTPQVFPHIDTSLVTRSPDSTPNTSVITSNLSLNSDGRTTFSTQSHIKQQDTNVQLLLRLPDGKVVKLSAVEMTAESESSNASIHSSTVLTTPTVIVDEPMSPSGHINRTVLLHGGTTKPQPPNIASSSDKMALAKQKLKEALTQNQKLTANAAVPETAPLDKVRIPTVKESKGLLAPAVSRKPMLAARDRAEKRARDGNGSSGNSGDDSESKRQKFLERNRAAASRCRQKRKNWVNMLEHRSNLMHSTNQQLIAEVAQLKSEVAQLKTLLLAHRDCPVTKAMNESGIIQIIEQPNMTEIRTQVRPTPATAVPVIRVVPAPRICEEINPLSDTSNIVCVTENKAQTFVIAPMSMEQSDNQKKETVIVKHKLV